MDVPFEPTGAPSNGPQTNAIVWTFAALATSFLGLRVVCKYRKHNHLWWDDWLLVASWFLMIAACSLVSVNVAAGFGKHDKDVDPREFDGLGMRNMIVGSMLNLSAAWSKTSFAVSLLRIATPRLRIVIWLLIVSMNILMHAGVVIGWVACHPVEKFWKYNIEGECWPAKITLPISIFINVYSGCMDLVLALLSWCIIIKLHMNLREKIGIAMAMSMGVFAGVTAIVKGVGLTVLDGHDYNC
ncbi:hypothetical protein F4819DRAFT_510703 [Hypoxylon fuscum]|nr:hypothetical protein F4819DRAFT_510703 [Hypoxylon fuscum]